MADDPFERLGLAARFGLTPAEIESAYLRRVAQLHPDVAGDETDVAARTAELNAARGALLDPERRADALLSRLGGPGAAEDKSLPDGFLMEIMETRQQIEADLEDDPAAARERWWAWAEEERGRYAAEAARLFERSELAEIRRRLNAWRYIERLAEQLDPACDPGKARGP